VPRFPEKETVLSRFALRFIPNRKTFREARQQGDSFSLQTPTCLSRSEIYERVDLAPIGIGGVTLH